MRIYQHIYQQINNETEEEIRNHCSGETSQIRGRVWWQTQEQIIIDQPIFNKVAYIFGFQLYDQVFQ